MQTRSKSEIDLIEKLQEDGYDHHMIFNKGKIYVDEVKNGKAYQSEDIFIDEEYRYEGVSNPDDMSIIYAISTKDGHKGSIVIAYGPNGNLEAAEFFKEVEEKSTD